MFLVLINYKKPLEIVDKYVAAHRSYLEEGYQKNYFIVSGPKNPRTGGIILSQLSDKDMLMQVIHKDPFYLEEVADYEVIEFNPVKFHKEFEKFI